MNRKYLAGNTYVQEGWALNMISRASRIHEINCQEHKLNGCKKVKLEKNLILENYAVRKSQRTLSYPTTEPALMFASAANLS